jgi:predicted Zn-dependent protease
MAKFDKLIKFLGKEDQYAPEEIESGLNNMEGVASDSNDFDENQELSEENLANIENLLNMTDKGGGQPKPPVSDDLGDLDLDELGEIPIGKPQDTSPTEEPDFDIDSFDVETPSDEAPSGLDNIEDFITQDKGESPETEAPSDFDFPEMTSDDEGTSFAIEDTGSPEFPAVDEDFPQEFPEAAGDDFDIEDLANIPGAYDDKKPEAPQPFDIDTEEDEAIRESSAYQMPSEETASEDEEGIDPEILDELKNLDTAPPPKEQIYQSASDVDDDMIKQALEEQDEDEFQMEDFEPEQDDFQMPGVETPREEENELGEVDDLLRNLTPSTDEDMGAGIMKERQEEEPDFGGPTLEDETSGLADLSALMGEEPGIIPEPELEVEEPKPEEFPEAPGVLGDEGITLEPPVGEIAASEEPDLGIPLETGEMDEFPEIEESEEIAEIGELELEPSPKKPEPKEELGELSLDIPDLDISKTIAEERREAFSKPSFAEKPVKAPKIDLDEDKALKIRGGINRLSDADTRKRIRRAFLDNMLSEQEAESLIAMLLLHEDEEKIADFINKIIPPEEKEEPAEYEEAPEIAHVRPRRVIYAEEARKAQEFQKEFENLAKYAAIALGVLLLLGFAMWRLVWIPSRANREYNRGLEAIQIQAYDNAETHFQSGKQIGGPNMDWYNKFALTYLEKGEERRAMEKFNEALEYKPDDRQTIFNLAEYLKSLDPPRFSQAIDLYERLLGKKRDDFVVIDRIGTTYIKWGEYTRVPEERIVLFDEANSIYQNYIARHTKHIPSYFRLLSIALKSKEAEMVDIFYDAIKDIDQNAVHVEVMTELGEFYIDNREMPRALDVFKRLTAFLDKRTHFDRRTGRTKIDARDANERLQFAETYYQYARFLTVNMDFLQAINSASNSIILNEKKGEAYNLLGEIYYITESVPNHKHVAREHFNEAIRYSSDYYKPYANLGHIYFYDYLNFPDPQSALTEALRNYEIARQIHRKNDDKKDFLLQYNLSWLYYRFGNYQRAFDEMHSLYIDEPYNPALSYALGNIYFRMANNRPDILMLARIQYDKAIEYYQRLADRIGFVNPDLERHKEIFTQLARSYNNRGVIYATLAQRMRQNRPENQQRALLDFYNSKNSANRIKHLYPHTEYNIKYILNERIPDREPSFDSEIPKRTTLQKLIEEFRINLIQTI